MADEQSRGAFKQLYGGNEVKVSTDHSSQKDLSSLSVKVNVDVSDALKGLKAVQREARRTSRNLKELEVTAKEMGISTEQAASMVKTNE